MSYYSSTTPLRVALFASACLFVTPAALAQGQDDQDTGDQRADSTAEGESNAILVTATPIRDTNEASLQLKRESLNVVEIIASDAIGRLPDQNLADTLGRVPGLAIERDQGQARFINFRGAPFRFTSIAFNGIDVPGAEDGRIPRFDSFPASITSGIEVNKAITANMPGEAVSGFINVQTASPFDRDGIFFSAENRNVENIDKGMTQFVQHDKGQCTDSRQFYRWVTGLSLRSK